MELVSIRGGKTDQFPVGMRVLAVDDNPLCLRKLEDLLLLCKYHVTKTTEPKKALEMLREKSNMFDLAITDVEMPDAYGFKLLQIGLEMDLPVIMLSVHSDYDSVNKGIIYGACDYLVKPVGLKELQNIWRHVVKKNISSCAKNIGPFRQLLPHPESHLVPSVSKKHNEDDSDRKEEHGEGVEQNSLESCTRMNRTTWTTELHQKFLDAIQQLGSAEKALPKQIAALMNVKGLPRINVARHLQEAEARQRNMAQFHGLGNVNATRQLPISTVLPPSHLPNLQGNNSTSFLQKGHHHNSGNSPSGPYNSTLSPSVQNVNLFQSASSPLKPLMFPKSNFSVDMRDSKSIKEQAIGGGDSWMSLNSSASKFPNILKVTKTGSCIIHIPGDAGSYSHCCWLRQSHSLSFHGFVSMCNGCNFFFPLNYIFPSPDLLKTFHVHQNNN